MPFTLLNNNGVIMQTVKLVELYEKKSSSSSFSTYGLREIFINPEYVVFMRPDAKAPALLVEGKLPEGLEPATQFTRLQISRGSHGSEVTVVGSLETVSRKFDTREVLRG